MVKSARGLGLLLLLLLLAFALRAIWPLADPADRLSWSTGPFTDPAAIVHGARDAVLFGDWNETGARGHAFFPLWNGIVYACWSLFGVGRLSLQLLTALVATAGVGAAALAARGAGLSPVAAAATLGGLAWLVLFGRVPLAEHLVVLLLAGAAALALDARPARLFAAGLLTGAAIWFAKLHAALFLPALLGFLLVRGDGARTVAATLGGVAVATGAWLVLVFPWAGAEMRQQFAGLESLYGRGPESILQYFTAPWSAVHTAGLLHRMPILGVVGAAFVLSTFLSVEARRRRHEDGTALFAWWFLVFWLGTSILPYAAPRYYIPTAVALGLCAVAQCAEWWRGAPPRGGARGVGFVARRAGFAVVVATVLVETTTHGLSFAADVGRQPGDWLYAQVRAARGAWEGATGDVGWAFGLTMAIAAGLAFVLVRTSPVPAGEASRRKLVKALVVAAAGLQLGQLAVAADRRSYALEDAKAAWEQVAPADAVLYGTLAPALAMDAPHRAYSRFGSRDTRLYGRPVTHAVVAKPGEVEPNVSALWQPGNTLDGSWRKVVAWSGRSSHLRTVELLALSSRFEPTPFEAAAVQGGPADFPGSEAMPDALGLRARLAFRAGDAPGAERHLRKALELRPGDPLLWFNLGGVLRRQGREDDAEAAWRRGLRLDPSDVALRNALEGLVAAR